MNLFKALIIAKVVNPRKTARAMRKDAKFLVELITEIVQVICIVIGFVITRLVIAIKYVCQSKTVKEEKLPENVIKMADYKLKKAE